MSQPMNALHAQAHVCHQCFVVCTPAIPTQSMLLRLWRTSPAHVKYDNLHMRISQVHGDLQDNVEPGREPGRNRLAIWREVRALVSAHSVDCTHACGILTRWSDEARLLLEYYGFPLDAYSLRLGAVRPCSEPALVRYKRTAAGRADEGRISLTHPLFIPHWSFDPASIRLGAQTAGQLTAARDVACADIPVLLLPEPILSLICSGAWTEVLMQVSWHFHLNLCSRSRVFRHLPGPGVVRDWPPQASPTWNHVHENEAKDDDILDQPSALISPGRCQDIAARVRSWAPAILTAEHLEDRLAAQADLEDVVSTLETWERGLRQVHGTWEGPEAAQKVKYNSEQMLACIRMAHQLKGGAGKLTDVVRHGLMLAFPQALALLEPSTVAKIPHPSLVQRYTLVFDVAMLLLERDSASEDVVRYSLSDSSPQVNYDWLMSQSVSILKANLVETFDAAVDLERAVRAHVSRRAADGIARAAQADILLEAGGCCEAEPPEPDWVPWLQSIRRHVRQHVDVPSALTTGHRGLAHKCAALVFKWSLTAPAHMPLKRYAESFISSTGDMGTELGIPDLSLEDHDGLLPGWMDRGSFSLDIEGCDGPLQQGRADELSDDVDGPLLMDDAHEEDTSADPPPPGYFMPNALTVAGMMHIVSNATQDMHVHMQHWPLFWKQLKVLESFLRCKERRDLYIWTCLTHTSFSNRASMFQYFRGSLYEDRWGEVISFMRRLPGLLRVLAATWDNRRFASGADLRGEVMPQQGAGAEGAGQSDAGSLPNFDPKDLTALLVDPVFFKYLDMCLLLDGIPEDIARWSGGCSCHEALTAELSPHLVAKVMTLHYGVPSCPLAGKRAPELAASRVTDVVDELVRAREADLLLLRVTPGAPAPTPADWSIVISDFARGRAYLSTVLQMKLQFWTSLPWLLCGLAHTDESAARRCACSALEAFQQDPRKEAHHRITWQWLQPGSMLSAALRKFANGSLRSSLPMEFRRAIAALRFVPVNETTIEEKHASIARRAKGQTNTGVVQVSLAGRMAALDRSLLMDAEASKDISARLLLHFTAARSLHNIPRLLNLAEHPALLADDSMDPQALSTTLRKIIYRTDLSMLFESKASVARCNMRAGAKERRLEARLVTGRQAACTGEIDMVRCLMRQHISETGDPFKVYSLPRSLVEMEGLHSSLHEPATKRARLLSAECVAVAEDADGPLMLDVLDGEGHRDGNGEPADEPIFFSIVLARPHLKKHVHVPVGAGGRLDASGMAVAVHRQASYGESPAVSSGSSSRDSVFILDALRHDVHRAREEYLEWSASETMWTLRDLAALGNFDEIAVAKLVQSFFAAGAFPSEGDAANGPGLAPSEGDMPLLEVMRAHGLAQVKGGIWSLSQKALSCVETITLLLNSRRVFECRPHLALQDFTSYELMTHLASDGWSWEFWAQRKRAANLIPDGYMAGADKVWYSTLRQVSRKYLLCLATAHELFQKGLASVPHGKTEAQYAAILSGDFNWGRARQQARHLALDIEPQDDQPPPPQAPEEAEDQDLMDVLADEGFEVALVEALAEALESQALEQPVADPAEHHVPGGEAAPMEVDDDLPLIALVDGRVQLQPPDPLAVAPPPAAPGDAPDLDTQADAAPPSDDGDLQSDVLRKAAWGVFKIRPKHGRNQGGGSGLYGGWEASCPFHKKSRTTPACRKFISITGPTLADRHHTLRMLLSWCVVARNYSRQRDHLHAFLPTPPPTTQALRALRIDAGPDEPARTDDELDEMDRAARAEGGRASGPGASSSSAR